MTSSQRISARRLALVFAATALLSGQSAQAVTLVTAQQVVDQFKKLTRPGKGASEFTHWTYNTAAFTTAECWAAASPNQRNPALEGAGPTRGGAYTGPTDDERERTCASVARTGFAPVCTHSTVWAREAPAVSNLPSDYISFKGEPKSLQVAGTLYCYMTPDRVQKQPFVAPFQAEWSQLPSTQNVNLPSGARTLQMGTVVLTVPGVPDMNGKPYREPRSAVQF